MIQVNRLGRDYFPRRIAVWMRIPGMIFRSLGMGEQGN